MAKFSGVPCIQCDGNTKPHPLKDGYTCLDCGLEITGIEVVEKMGDMGDVFRDMRKDKQNRHTEMHTTNRYVIGESGLYFADRGETLLFRQPDKPRVDFYPSTGRWKNIDDNNKIHKGGAKAFLKWFAKQKGRKR